MTWTAPGLPAWKPGNTQVVIRIIIITHHSNVFYSSTYTWCQILWLWLPSTWLRLLLPNQQLHLQWPGPVYNRDFLSVEEGDWPSILHILFEVQTGKKWIVGNPSCWLAYSIMWTLVTLAGGTFPAAVIWPVKNLPKWFAARTTALYLRNKPSSHIYSYSWTATDIHRSATT